MGKVFILTIQMQPEPVVVVKVLQFNWFDECSDHCANDKSGIRFKKVLSKLNWSWKL
jgi:hypothetical protein